MEHQEIVLPLLINSSEEEVFELFRNYLNKVTKNLLFNNVHKYHKILLQDDTVLALCKDPNSLEKIKQMAEFANKIHSDNLIKDALVAHIKSFKNIYVVTFIDTGIKERADLLISSVYYTLQNTHGIMYSNGVFIDNYGKKILDVNGNTDLEDYKPVMKISEMYKRNGEVTKEDQEIYNQSIEKLKKENIPFLENMELALRYSDIKLRSSKDIAQRAVTLFGVAAYSEIISDETLGLKRAQDEFFHLHDLFKIESSLSMKERTHIFSENAEKASIFTWRYEACGALLWVLGLIEFKNYHDQFSVEDLYNIITSYKSIDELLDSVKLRSIEEIFKQQDLVMRYRWACIETKEQYPNLNASVLYERHYAFNWVLTKLLGEEWDETQTPA